jgi:hypothetical protein
MDARQAAQNILEAGKSGDLSAGPAAIAEATAPGGGPKYPPRICRHLARIIVCRNYAKPVLQLCHLVNAADACARRNESYERLLLGVPQATPRHFRDQLSGLLAAGGWRRPGFSLEAGGIATAYDDAAFLVSFSRMPLLAALLEFVVGMEGYAAIDDIFSGMLGKPSGRAVGDAANAISRRIYAYLSDNLPSAQNMAKFNRIVEFLAARSGEEEVEIEDPAILEFWLEESGDETGHESGFRTYRAVLEAFVAFARSLELAADRRGASQAAPVGGDAEAGEIDPEDLYGLLDAPGQWRSPLPLLDEDPAARVKFLTKREKDGLWLLMEMGPLARSLPLSLLRAETFGPAQARLTQAMRRCAPPDEVGSMTELDELADYRAFSQGLGKIRRQVNRVMLASLHVLLRERAVSGGGNVAVLPGQGPDDLFRTIADGPEPPPLPADADVAEEAARAFRAVSRRGFSEEEIEEESALEGFCVGAGILQAIAQETDSILERLARLDSGNPDLADGFSRDRRLFSNQFKRLYGVSP